MLQSLGKEEIHVYSFHPFVEIKATDAHQQSQCIGTVGYSGAKEEAAYIQFNCKSSFQQKFQILKIIYWCKIAGFAIYDKKKTYKT